MGMADRDYMRERRPADADFRPPRRRGAPTWVVVLVCCAALAGLYRAGDQYLAYRAAQDDSRRQAKAAAVPALRREPPSGSPPSTTGLTAAPDRSGSGSGAPVTSRPAAVQTFSKCVDPRGRTVYSDGPCGAGERASRVEVRSDVNVVDAEPVPLTPPPQAHAGTQVATTPRPFQTPQSPAYDPRAACTTLNQAIAGYDAQARQAHSGQMQDWISARRKEARDEQFRLRC
ncbi:DUF4124 domain-containing protein [Xylophilus ampelinus]|uniref:DUF4124 domain-containing protein n=2 Tax=Xylophilus ampelinus TaxID=54067 RepID=A0A318SN98_9BURK|nr:DUF4124 domain-containing protein [Xylophilus ampelinus]PYE78390.1 hypothetical protein DFQ15_10740 [Xylophilus ampelinus]